MQFFFAASSFFLSVTWYKNFATTILEKTMIKFPVNYNEVTELGASMKKQSFEANFVTSI